MKSTVFASVTAHLTTTGPVGSSPTLEGAPASRRPESAEPAASRGARGDRRRPGATSLWRDPFRRQRARYGPGAGFRWWHRLGAATALLVLIGVVGVLLAALVGFLAFVGGVALEAIIG